MFNFCALIHFCRNLIETFHAGMKRTVQLQLDLNCVIADFNMLSLTCNHAGATALKFCPKCHVSKFTNLRLEE